MQASEHECMIYCVGIPKQCRSVDVQDMLNSHSDAECTSSNSPRGVLTAGVTCTATGVLSREPILVRAGQLDLTIRLPSLLRIIYSEMIPDVIQGANPH